MIDNKRILGLIFFSDFFLSLALLDILIDIQPMNIHVTQGDPAQFSCSFSGEHRVQREDIVWLKGIVGYSIR